MKILHLIPDLGKGGAERLALETCLAQQELGHHAKLVYFANKVEYSELAAAANAIHCPAYYLPSIFGKSSGQLVPLEDLVQEFQPDIVHSHRYVAEVIRTELNHFTGAGYLTHLHNAMPEFRKPTLPRLLSKRGIARAWERRRLLGRYAVCDNHFLAISQHMKDFFVENLPSEWHDHIHLLPNAIDVEDYVDIKVSYPKEGPIRLVNTGRLVKWKGQAELVRAVAQLVDQGKDLQLDLLGDGPERNRLDQLIQELGLNQRVHLRGHVDDPADYLANAHLYVHSATGEPFGLSIIEALAAGVPVVAVNDGGPSDILGATQCGILMDDNSPEQLAKGIEQALSSPDHWEALSIAGKARASEYAIKPYVKKLLELYKTIRQAKGLSD